MSDQPLHLHERDTAPFPSAGVDGFLSHFVLAVQFYENPGDKGGRSGALVHLSLPSAVQTVARSAPFHYQPTLHDHGVELALPARAQLPARVRRSDFQVSPPGFFEGGRESVWLQIVNLDARAETALGPIRIILGETFRQEYEDVFEPSFGAAESIHGKGFPARLFFSPNAVIETPLGALKTRPKALVGASIDAFPPVGSYPSLQHTVALDRVDDLREANAAGRPLDTLKPIAAIRALAHPIDAVLLGGDPYEAVAATIGA